MKKPNDIPQLRIPPKPKVDITQLKDIKCENPGCGNYTFQEAMMLKHVPALLTENGKDGIVPIPVFVCNVCGYVNSQFLPSFMKGQSVNTTDTTTSPKSSIEIIK